MSTPPADDLTTEPEPRFRLGFGGWLVLAGCGVFLFWFSQRIREMVDPVQGSLKLIRSGTDHDERVRAVRDLGMSAKDDLPAVVPGLIAALDDVSPEIRAAAARSLGSTGHYVLLAKSDLAKGIEARLVQALDDADDEVRVAATDALRSMLAAPGEAFPANLAAIQQGLSAMLKSPNENVRRAAASVFGGFLKEGEPTPDALLKAFQNDPSKIVRAAAASSLRDSVRDKERVLRLLFDGLAREDLFVRRPCAESLQRFRADATSLPELLDHLKSADPNVRARSASVLGLLGGKAASAFSALLAILKEPSPKNQPRSMGGNSMPFPYPLELNPKSEAVWAIGRIAPAMGEAAVQEAIAAFFPLLDDPNDEVRSQAIVTLGDFPTSLGSRVAPFAAKLESIRRNESNPFVRSEIDDVLASLKALRERGAAKEPLGKR